MALVHDIAEAICGDITPSDNIKGSDKHQIELNAVERIAKSVKGASGSDFATELIYLWEEYDAGVTPEAALVKQIDKLEMCVQALEYEQDCGMAPVPGHALVRLPPAAERSPKSRTDSGPKRGRSTDSEQPSPSGSYETSTRSRSRSRSRSRRQRTLAAGEETSRSESAMIPGPKNLSDFFRTAGPKLSLPICRDMFQELQRRRGHSSRAGGGRDAFGTKSSVGLPVTEPLQPEQVLVARPPPSWIWSPSCFGGDKNGEVAVVEVPVVCLLGFGALLLVVLACACVVGMSEGRVGTVPEGVCAYSAVG